MQLIDTHTHIYLEDFEADIDNVIQSAKALNITQMLLPNVDSSTIERLKKLCRKYPENCFAMMGLHPTLVNVNFEQELKQVEQELSKNNYIAVGEIGIDLYWDKTFYKEQVESFSFQLSLAQKYQLPVVIHMRNSFQETIEIVKQSKYMGLKGVFHCFSGTLSDAIKAVEIGYKLGIGGVVTFKNSGLTEIVKYIDLKHLVLETDAPYLTPHPYRGKRNEPAYLQLIAEKVAEIKNISVEEVANVTTANAKEVFCF